MPTSNIPNATSIRSGGDAVAVPAPARAKLGVLFKRVNEKARRSFWRVRFQQPRRTLFCGHAEQLVNGVRYEKLNQWYEMTLLEPEIESWADYLVPSPRHGVYDHVIFQSEIEEKFVRGLEDDDRVQLYLKLPSWFQVDTPVGGYNPDWAIVWEDRDQHGSPTGKTLYLVRETKDLDHPESLRLNEKRKVRCGQHHFKDALRLN